MTLAPSRLLLSPSELLRAMGEHTVSFPKVQTQLKLQHFHFSAPESLWCGVPISLLFASTDVLALALLSPAAVFVRLLRDAVALSAAAGTAAENKTDSGADATVTAAALSTADAGTAAVDTSKLIIIC